VNLDVSQLAGLRPNERLGWRNGRRFGHLVALVISSVLSLAKPARAQDHTVLFGTSEPGVSKAVTNWGMGIVGGADVIQSGLIHMGADQIDVIILPFTLMDPLTNGDISAASKAQIDSSLAIAGLAGNKSLAISSGTGDGVNPWYITGPNRVDATRWVQCMIATKRHMNRSVAWAQPFNEPDFGPWNQGNPEDLYNIIALLQNDPTYASTKLAGPATLNTNYGVDWYNAIKSRGPMGTTHAIAGSFDNYVNFFNALKANGGMSFCPELHNLVEAIVGAEYGMGGGTWWLRADLARGDFVKACQGKQLAYVEDRARWTAAAVYRGTDGAVKAFLGSSERDGQTTSYRFFSKDRDVFYDGDGPRRDFLVSIPLNQEKRVQITWGADAPSAIHGRYVMVNRNSAKVMEVAGASTTNGANIQQNTYTGGTHQQWNIVPFSATFGDQSYHAITAVHSGKAADVYQFSYDDGGDVRQWDNLQGLNQLWFFEYAGDGWFYIRSRWSGKYLEVSNSSTASGAKVLQRTGSKALNQQWRLIPVSATVEFDPPAAPTGITASARAVSVQLNWDANVEADLASYTVLRATSSGGPYEIAARGLTNNAFTDKAANQPRTFFYVVRAVDRSLNSSVDSEQASATPTGNPTLVARYAFDRDFDDSSGNANHATTTGSPAFVAGKYGSAMDLDGASRYAMSPAGFLASVSSFTMAVWVNWDGGGAWQRIFDFGNGTSQYMFLTPSSGSGTLRFAMTLNGAGAEQILETSALPQGQWQHVAITRVGNTCRLYRNGLPVVSGSMTISPASFNPALNYLGESQYEADPLFNGRLDELFIYNYALSDAEIARLAANQPPALGGLQTPGDGNQDGALDISDAIWLLSYLFVDDQKRLPCSGARTASTGDLALLDANGDARVDIADAVRVLGFLFGDSSPPVLGTACVSIDGCPDQCAP
jgi:hypothetical protein